MKINFQNIFAVIMAEALDERAVEHILHAIKVSVEAKINNFRVTR